MKWYLSALVLSAFLELSRANGGDNPPQVQVTKTSVKIARSLDPEKTETMTVRTRTGDIATLIVKKREENARSLLIPPEAEIHRSSSGERRSSEQMSFEPVRSRVRTGKSLDHHHQQQQQKQERSLTSSEESTISPLPAPVVINSSTVLVKENAAKTKSPESSSRDGRRLQIDSDGIPIIHGIRVPDDESDKQVWRNARVINGILVPYDKNNKKHPFNITKTATASYEWSKPVKKPVTQTLHTSTVKVTIPQPGYVPKWKPTSNDRIGLVTSKPYNNGYLKEASNVNPSWQKVDPSDRPMAKQPMVAREKYKQHPSGLWIREDDTTANYEEKYVTDKIIDYIRNINKQEMYNTHNHQKKFTIRDARMVRSTVTPTPTPMMPPVEKSGGIQSRVLHNPGNSVYPNSLLYSPTSKPPSRVSFEDGVRTPVLQYAHPELGVQSAKVESASSIDETMLKGDGRREQALAYFSHDIHADRSPFAFEPGLEDEAKVEIPDSSGSNGGMKKGRDTNGVLTRPKKTLSYFYDSQSVHPYPDITYNKYHNKGGPNYKINGGYPSPYYAAQTSENRPFWERLSESFKEQMQTGIDKVSDLTRPVVEPLVEATHKISQNLGLNSGGKELSTIKEKLGVAGSSSVLLPALGLVAGGAALGLGAVAVGSKHVKMTVKLSKTAVCGRYHARQQYTCSCCPFPRYPGVTQKSRPPWMGRKLLKCNPTVDHPTMLEIRLKETKDNLHSSLLSSG